MTTNDSTKIPVGLNEEGVVNLDLTVHPHALIMGGVGRGKTTLAENIREHCQNTPETWGGVFHLNDKNTFDVSEALTQAESVLADLRSYPTKRDKNKAVLIMMEEFMMLTPNSSDSEMTRVQKARILSELNSIVRLGRSTRVHTILTSQLFDVPVNAGNPQRRIVDLVSNRILMGVPRNDVERDLVGDGDFGPDLGGHGIGYLVTKDDENPVKFAVRSRKKR